MTTLGRNDPCFCGSGKKYKKCCLNDAKPVDYGSCDGRVAIGRCAEPATGVLACKVCEKRYGGCKAHYADVRRMMNGHVLRKHPETIPDTEFDKVFENESVLSSIREVATAQPELWQKLIARIEAREEERGAKYSGRAPGQVPRVEEADELSDVAHVMKKEAVKRTGKEPSFRILHGWKFGLSYGDVPEITREMYERFATSLVKRLGWTEPAPATFEEFIVLRDAEKARAGKPGEELLKKEWIFSASLHPRGRASTEADWIFVSRMAAAIGAAPESLRTPFETTDPNETHYWIWFQEAEVPS